MTNLIYGFWAMLYIGTPAIALIIHLEPKETLHRTAFVINHQRGLSPLERTPQAYGRFHRHALGRAIPTVARLSASAEPGPEELRQMLGAVSVLTAPHRFGVVLER